MGSNIQGQEVAVQDGIDAEGRVRVEISRRRLEEVTLALRG